MNIPDFYVIDRYLMIFGWPITTLIDSVLIWIAYKKGVKVDIGIIRNWYALHLKYGILRVNIYKIILVNIFGLAPLFLPNWTRASGLLVFIYLAHIITSAHALIKYRNVDMSRLKHVDQSYIGYKLVYDPKDDNVEEQ